LSGWLLLGVTSYFLLLSNLEHLGDLLDCIANNFLLAFWILLLLVIWVVVREFFRLVKEVSDCSQASHDIAELG